MSKTLAIFLISIHLSGNTELGQILKLPQLVHHFFQHQQINPNLKFFQFLAMHYGGDDGTNADDDWDQRLPYHSPDINTTAVVYSPMVKELPVFDNPLDLKPAYNDQIKEGISSKHVLRILQPPRLA